MSEVKRKRVVEHLHPLMKTGLAVIGVSALWWLFYYGQFQGLFAQLPLKFDCLAADSIDCQNLRDAIGGSAFPMYQPGLWWGGIACSLVGWFLARFAGKQA